MCWRQCDTGGWARPQLPATAAHTASSATSHSRHNQPHTAWPLAHTGPWPGHYSKVCMCCPVPGSSWSPPHPVPPRHGRQMPRVRGVLQPRPGQHTSTPLAAEVTPSHNRQPAAPPRCHVSRGRVRITITMPGLKLCISRGSTNTSPAQLGGGWQLGQAANDNNHCWHCYTRCSGAELNGLYIDLDARGGSIG